MNDFPYAERFPVNRQLPARGGTGEGGLSQI
jgi:hypothetical protein